MRKQLEDKFQTFKPKDARLVNAVDYYYLDSKPTNERHTFTCFPHVNSTISLYQSHVRLEDGAMLFEPSAPPCQIFTPIREKVLKVTQLGKVYRIVLVFHPLGIQQFYANLDFTKYITEHSFFDQAELQSFFSTTTIDEVTTALDQALIKRFIPNTTSQLNLAIQRIAQHEEGFKVADLTNELGMTRQHLNRLFKQHLGVSVKKFQDIALFRQSVHRKLMENPEENFTSLAYQFHFSDQSHFTKTYKSLADHSPKDFFNKGTRLGEETLFWHLNP